MPSRTPAAAASTLQNLRHVYITDDILSEAFTRFLRVSHTYRRNSSHVPGPLEARRRLAKRRMGLTSAAASGTPPPPGHDFGGLFGLGHVPSPSRRVETGWKWEPAIHGPSPPPPIVSGNGDWRPWMRPDPRKAARYVEVEERVQEFLHVTDDPVQESKTAFEALLHPLQALHGETRLEKRNLQPLIDFLQSSANEPAAQLTLHLVQWLAERTTSAGIWKNIVAVIAQKIALRTLSEEEESAICLALLAKQSTADVLGALLDSLPQQLTLVVLRRITSAVMAGSDAKSVGNWLEVLRGCDCAKTARHDAEKAIWAAVYEPLAQKFRPEELSRHFSTLEDEALARVLLRYWVPSFVSEDIAADRKELDLSVMPPNSLDTFDLHAMQAEYRYLRHLREQLRTSNNALVDLVALLAANNLPYNILLTTAIAFWQTTATPKTIATLFGQLCTNEIRITIPCALATTLITSFMYSGHLHAALELATLIPNFSLSTCRDLPLHLVEAGRTHSEKIWVLLDRWAEEDGVTLAQKSLFDSPLPSDLVDVVHECAYAWASSPHLRPRTSFRRVWECYRFLQDNNAPINPLMTRALVKAGIVNLVSGRLPLSKDRVSYILSLVGRVEGEAVKQELDRIIFEYWQANRGGVRSKSSEVKRGEKFAGEQWLANGEVRWVRWSGRTGSKGQVVVETPRAGYISGENVALTSGRESSKAWRASEARARKEADGAADVASVSGEAEDAVKIEHSQIESTSVSVWSAAEELRTGIATLQQHGESKLPVRETRDTDGQVGKVITAARERTRTQPDNEAFIGGAYAPIPDAKLRSSRPSNVKAYEDAILECDALTPGIEDTARGLHKALGSESENLTSFRPFTNSFEENTSRLEKPVSTEQWETIIGLDASAPRAYRIQSLRLQTDALSENEPPPSQDRDVLAELRALRLRNRRLIELHRNLRQSTHAQAEVDPREKAPIDHPSLAQEWDVLADMQSLRTRNAKLMEEISELKARSSGPPVVQRSAWKTLRRDPVHALISQAEQETPSTMEMSVNEEAEPLVEVPQSRKKRPLEIKASTKRPRVTSKARRRKREDTKAEESSVCVEASANLCVNPLLHHNGEDFARQSVSTRSTSIWHVESGPAAWKWQVGGGFTTGHKRRQPQLNIVRPNSYPLA